MKVLRTLSLAFLTIFLVGTGASAQDSSTRTITNNDLEKYRDARVKTDEEYRQTYAQRGLPSPEELERRVDEKIKRLSEYSAQLGDERRLREYVELMSAAASNSPQIIYLPQEGGPGYNPYGGGSIFFSTGLRFRDLSNVDKIRYQAMINRDIHRLPNFHTGGFPRGGFGGFRTGGGRGGFSPRR
jgi:hypothetical protein